MSLRFVVFVQTFCRDIKDSDSIALGFFLPISAVPYPRISFTCRFLCCILKYMMNDSQRVGGIFNCNPSR